MILPPEVEVVLIHAWTVKVSGPVICCPACTQLLPSNTAEPEPVSGPLVERATPLGRVRSLKPTWSYAVCPLVSSIGQYALAPAPVTVLP